MGILHRKLPENEVNMLCVEAFSRWLARNMVELERENIARVVNLFCGNYAGVILMSTLSIIFLENVHIYFQAYTDR